MIVAMGAVEMVQMTVHEVVNVVPMGHCLMATGRPVNMRLLMSGAVVARCAFIRIRRVHFNAVLVHMPIMRMVQVSIVEIVCVAIVLHGRMTTIRAMLVGVSPRMLLMSLSHGLLPLHNAAHGGTRSRIGTADSEFSLMIH